MDYIFGYGSIINDSSRIATSTTSHSPIKKEAPLGTKVTSDSDSSGGGLHDLAVAARLSPDFARRVWNFRCPTGFTALGIVLNTKNPQKEEIEVKVEVGDEVSDDHVVPGVCASEQGVKEVKAQGINGVLFPITSHHDLTAFDIREVGYTRIPIPLHKIRILSSVGCAAAQTRARALQSSIITEIQMTEEKSSLPSEDQDQNQDQDQDQLSHLPRIWIYVPDASHTAAPSVEYPILQTYVDVCIEGCLLWGGRKFALEFLTGTTDWSEFYLNDTPMSRRPWLHRKDYKRVDECLKAVSSTIRFDCRKHPDEFASLHLTSLKGMFGVPPRNRTFLGRESFIRSVHAKLSDLAAPDEDKPPGSMSDGDNLANQAVTIAVKSQEASFGCCNQQSNILKQVEVSGIGGVGKSQIAIEYAHRYYSSSCYALVAWFRAESAASIATDMRKLAFDLGIIHDKHRASASACGGGDNNVVVIMVMVMVMVMVMLVVLLLPVRIV
jgi:hypothetical protein